MRTEDGYLIVGPDTDHSDFAQHGTGYVPRDYSEFPLNGQEYNSPPTMKPMSDQELRERIAEKDNEHSWLEDIATRVGLPPKDQGQSNYCWIHARVHAMELEIIASGAPKETLSAFYAAYQIKHGSNSGGSGVQGTNVLVKTGTCAESLCPPQTFRVHETPEMKASAALNRVVTCTEIQPDNHQLIQTMLVHNQAVSVGIPAWSHEIVLVGLTIVDGRIKYKGRNSWGAGYGKNGFFVVSDKYSRFDEAMRIASTTNSVA